MQDDSLAMYKLPLIGLAIVSLLSFFPIVGALVNNTDRDMRANLLAQSAVAAKALDLSSLRRLSGSEEDIGSDAYIHVKEQLASIRTASAEYRFVYLMGKKSDGSLFFYADSEPEDSGDYSPPGQAYPNASKELQSLFSRNTGFVEGPLEDDWGLWVSALSPVVDLRSGETLAVLGIDVAADTWRTDVMVRVLPSIGFISIILACVVIWFFISLRRVLAAY